MAYLKLACSQINIFEGETGPPRILRGPPHYRSLETHLMPRPIQTCRQQFWYQVCRKGARRPPHLYP